MNLKLILIVVVLAAFSFFSTQTEDQDQTAEVTTEPAAGSLWTEPTTGMQFVWVPSGCFDMGSDLEENEQPVHHVCVEGFYLGKYEVTAAQYELLSDHKGSSFDEATDIPANNIAWFMADQYIQKLNKRSNEQLRFPSEAEWEYACSAGGKHKTYCGDGQAKQLAWHKTNSNNQPHPVGKLHPNAFGLYDMSGNVWEWVEDAYHANYQGAPADGSAWTQQNMNGERVLRGGAYADNAEDALASFRTKLKFTIRYPTFGFRVAMTPQ